MATATSKKTGKAAAKRSKQQAKPAAGAKKKRVTRTGSTAKAKSKTTAKKAAKAKSSKSSVQEPERSAPAMAEVDADVLEFIAAIDQFKQQHGRPFPSWSEVLLIVRQLGYKRG